MAATLHRLRTKKDRLREEQADMLRDLLNTVPDLPRNAVVRIRATIDAQTASKNGWTFVMISPTQNSAVVRWLREHSALPLVAVVLWAELFQRLDRETGEIAATRDELAEAVGTNARDVSRIMTELESVGAIIRHREKVAGMRGPGRVIYCMNPRVATHLPGAARDKAQSEAPLLRLIEGQTAG